MSAAGEPENGFTLLEALVVIAIVAMVSAIVAPNIGRSVDMLSLRQSAGLLQADLRVARATALRTGNEVTVVPLQDSHGYDWLGGTRRLPPNVTLKMSGPVSFFADGSLIPATISVAGSGRRISISLDPTTGAITAGNR